MDEPTRCPGEWFGVVCTGDLDPGLRLVVHPGGAVRSVGRPPAIAFSWNRRTTWFSPASTPAKETCLGPRNVRSRDGDVRLVLRPDRRVRSALNRWGVLVVLYLTAFVTVAALVYLVYAMLRPEKF